MLLILLVASLGIASLGIGGCKTAPTPPPTSPLDPPPKARRQVTLTLPLLGKGESFRLESLRGHPVLLFVFTTWSLRAQAEAGEVKKIDALYRSRGLRIVGLALDKRGEALVQTYVDFLNFRFPVLIADPENLELVAALGITHHVPRSVLFDREGHLVQDHLVGMTDFPKLYKAIEGLLRTGPTTVPTSRPH